MGQQQEQPEQYCSAAEAVELQQVEQPELKARQAVGLESQRAAKLEQLGDFDRQVEVAKKLHSAGQENQQWQMRSQPPPSPLSIAPQCACNATPVASACFAHPHS